MLSKKVLLLSERKAQNNSTFSLRNMWKPFFFLVSLLPFLKKKVKISEDTSLYLTLPFYIETLQFRPTNSNRNSLHFAVICHRPRKKQK